MMIIYAVSDSIGETAEQVARATASQFDYEVRVKRISYLKTREEIMNFINSIDSKNCMIISTIVMADIRDFLVQISVERGIHIVNVLGPCINSVARLTGKTPAYKPGAVRKLDQDYFKKIEAMEFAIAYDDSKDDRGIKFADVVLIGLSRTSKTPLCVYLANKGIKAANVPLVPEVSLPKELFEIDRKKIIGLTIDPLELIEIRKNRMSRMGNIGQIEYANTERILLEFEYSDMVMKKLRCKVIDVTRKAIEDTASLILHHIEWNE
ncbi:phosphotransferase [Fervidicella metallireducens AeB]|uniref:Putative pyruvate, phosphate dikinase regulatory protein n=1 Tax=Fervidicella metallireducens AeB TaxID=1403537 RepID=A0A017RTA8_9CLOT|nr:pyruvate, water dikinase regulatory protein [Fervidicella metallireducens]EYE87978.1 phosphotransferase [Fervidicella metallireducens AeB]